MTISKKWFNTVRRKFHRSSHATTLLPDTKTSPTSSSEETASFEDDIAALPTPSSYLKKDSTKIQAFFRGYLARPANKRLGKSQNCFRIVRRKSRKPSHTNINRPGSSIEEENVRQETTYSEDPTVAASSSQKIEITREDMAEARQTFRAGDTISTSSKKKRKRTSRNCFNIVFRRRSSRRDILSPDGNIPSNSTEEAVAKEEINETAASKTSSARNEEATNCKETINFVSEASSTLSSEKKDLTIEHMAAIKIQASFRGHLVRRQTFRARETIATSSKKKRKGRPQNCFSIGQRRFRRRSPKASRSSSTEEAIVKEDTIKVEDGNGAASSTPSSQKEELTKEDVAAVKIQAIFRGHRARRAFGSLKSLVSSSKNKDNRRRTLRVSRNLFDRVRRKFRKTPRRDIIFPQNNPCARISTDEAAATEETINFEDSNDATPPTVLSSSMKDYLTKEDVAAIIQAFFRGHLARRAYRALKSLVKLQAVARGACVRRQARIALHCMHALARLQVRVRARQLLDGDQVV